MYLIFICESQHASIRVNKDLSGDNKPKFSERQVITYFRALVPSQTVMISLRSVDLCQGSCTNEVGKIFGIFDPLSPCLHLGLIYSTKFTQPPLLHLLFGYPSPLSIQTSFVHGPLHNKAPHR